MGGWHDRLIDWAEWFAFWPWNVAAGRAWYWKILAIIVGTPIVMLQIPLVLLPMAAWALVEFWQELSDPGGFTR